MYLEYTSPNIWGIFSRKPKHFLLEIDNGAEYVEFNDPRTDQKIKLNLSLDGRRIGDTVTVDWAKNETRAGATMPTPTTGKITSLQINCHGDKLFTLDNLFTPFKLDRL